MNTDQQLTLSFLANIVYLQRFIKIRYFDKDNLHISHGQVLQTHSLALSLN